MSNIFNVGGIKANYKEVNIPKDILIRSFLASDVKQKINLLTSYIAEGLKLTEEEVSVLSNSSEFKDFYLNYYKSINVDDVVNYLKNNESLLDAIIDEEPDISRLNDVLMISKSKAGKFLVYMVERGQKAAVKSYDNVYEALKVYYSLLFESMRMLMS